MTGVDALKGSRKACGPRSASSDQGRGRMLVEAEAWAFMYLFMARVKQKSDWT